MIGIPTASPHSGHGIPAHHTSFDTPAQVDPKSLRDLAVMNAAYAYFIASAGPDQMHWMAELAVERGYDQINAATENSLDLVAAAQDADSLGRLLYWETARVDYNLTRETKAVKQAADLPQELAELASFAGMAEGADRKRRAAARHGTAFGNDTAARPQDRSRSRKDRGSPQANGHSDLWTTFRPSSGKDILPAPSGRRPPQRFTGATGNAIWPRSSKTRNWKWASQTLTGWVISSSCSGTATWTSCSSDLLSLPK